MSAPTRLGPHARAALYSALDQALRGAGVPRPGHERVQRLLDYTLDRVEPAMIRDAAEAEAAAQDPH